MIDLEKQLLRVPAGMLQEVRLQRLNRPRPLDDESVLSIALLWLVRHPEAVFELASVTEEEANGI